MIKPNDLRIGNVLKRYDGEIVIVENINEAGINGEFDLCWSTYIYNELSGIPLTEEWLLKFGFEKGIQKASTNTMYFDKKYNNTNLYYILVDKFPDCSIYLYVELLQSELCLRDIKYVHQLQNLIFALTGEELILNTEKCQTEE